MLGAAMFIGGISESSYAASIAYLESSPGEPNSEIRAAETGFLQSRQAEQAAIEPVQPNALSAIPRAILNMGACLCAGYRELLEAMGPVSTSGRAPVAPAAPVPPALFLFMAGLATVAGVARRVAVAGHPIASTRGSAVTLPHVSCPLVLVSNDVRFAQDLSVRLARYGMTTQIAVSLGEAHVLAVAQTPALVMIDRRQTGWRKLRQTAPFTRIPIMTLAPSGYGWTEEACLDDLEHGADSTHLCEDGARLLVAKVRALVRRSTWLEQAPTVIRGGQVELDIDRVEVRVAGQAHHLPPVQFKLLKYLMESPGRVFRRQELLDHIWGEGYAVEGHTLDVHICWLRRLLAHDPSSCQAITTIRGVGVKFVIDSAVDKSARVCASRLRQPPASRSSRSRRRVRRHLRVIQPMAMRAAG
jgi:DNA-binding response OmpR family regulator